jgi:probable HAF family extracellular repeat protein
MVGLGSLPGDSTSFANGVSADGSVVVGGAVQLQQAWRWTVSGGMVGLGFLPGDSISGANGVSGDGSVVVGFSSQTFAMGQHAEAFRWTPGGGMVGLGFLPGAAVSGADGVSADGSVVVGASGPLGVLGQAFRWTSSGGMVGLGFLPGDNASNPSSASADGSVVVGSSQVFQSASPSRAFIWDAAHGIRPLQDVLTADGLNLTGWTLESASVSANGLAFVGGGIDPSGHSEAWLAIIPEPGTGLLVLAGMLGLAGARSRRA